MRRAPTLRAMQAALGGRWRFVHHHSSGIGPNSLAMVCPGEGEVRPGAVTAGLRIGKPNHPQVRLYSTPPERSETQAADGLRSRGGRNAAALHRNPCRCRAACRGWGDFRGNSLLAAWLITLQLLLIAGTSTDATLYTLGTTSAASGGPGVFPVSLGVASVHGATKGCPLRSSWPCLAADIGKQPCAGSWIRNAAGAGLIFIATENMPVAGCRKASLHALARGDCRWANLLAPHPSPLQFSVHAGVKERLVAAAEVAAVIGERNPQTSGGVPLVDGVVNPGGRAAHRFCTVVPGFPTEAIGKQPCAGRQTRSAAGAGLHRPPH